ncbi:MAG: cupin domain-containing protein [Lachnospiraceae bacterium]|nr:cupin domain-containing protein [Lachnospiraceae bacterium]
MKCVVLAGGSGDALWPLSRRNYPKQFIHLHSGRSPFQEAVTRNLPFCDEFWILTNDKYENIVHSQLASFQGLNYRILLEGLGRQTAPVVLLAALEMADEEKLLVVSCDHIIGGGDYNGVIVEAEKLLDQSRQEDSECIVAVCCPADEQSAREHNFFDLYDDGRVDYIPAGFSLQGHCDAGLAGSLPDRGIERLVDSGIFLIGVGEYKSAIRKNKPRLYEGCLALQEKRRGSGAKEGSKRYFYPADQMETLSSVSIGDGIYHPWSGAGKVRIVKGDFEWIRLLSLEQVAGIWEDDEHSILVSSENTRVINRTGNQLVVVNEVPDLLVVNDRDAVYITKADQSSRIKSIIASEDKEQFRGFFDEGDVFYTDWGCKETLERNPDYSVKKLTILPGCSISMHKHEKRSEHWSVVSGVATIIMDGNEKEYQKNESIFVPIGCYHQIRNDQVRELVIIEVSVGESVREPGVDLIRGNGTDAEPEADQTKTVERQLLKLAPAYKDYLWGGRTLIDAFGMKTDLPKLAESWVLSAHRDGCSRVIEKEVESVSFDCYVRRLGKDGLGWKAQPYDRFPILVKFIDAARSLSVQVHPGDSYAMAHENDYGKNEMWYVISAEEGAFVYLGFERETTPGEVKERIREGTLTQILHKVPVKAGDSVMVPAGCVHAIGEGVLILEVQQSSNATYRLYDYNRLDANGRPRALHLEKALANMDYGPCDTKGGPSGCWEDMRGYRRLLLEQCKYFSVSRLEVDSLAEIVMDASTFYSVVILSGEGVIEAENTKEGGSKESLPFTRGDSFFLPAGEKILRIQGKCEAILSHI